MYNLITTAAFGLEASVKREIAALGLIVTAGGDGRIEFRGDASAICRANLWLRCADRVQIKIGEYRAVTFDELFEGAKALPWGDWIPKDGRFTVVGKSVKSALFSVPDCQAIVKKAVAVRLSEKYNIEWLPETGAEYRIQVALLNDLATLTIDTTGVSLHKRGNREESVVAPIRETLAAALIELSFWKPGRVLLDPFCGSGTIPIEAAMIAKNIAPGLNRGFAAESFGQIPPSAWREAREEARSLIKEDAGQTIFASDIDKNATAHAKANALKADVKRLIKFETLPFSEARLPSEYGVMITNPPYGERLGDAKAASALYSEMGRAFRGNKKWSVYVITPDEGFEKCFGRRADKKRKLFNGMIKTDYYQFFGERER